VPVKELQSEGTPADAAGVDVYEWARSTDGRWFGRVNFTVCDAYGAVVAEHQAVLVPPSALTERHNEPRR
jgi:hypothetical protein